MATKKKQDTTAKKPVKSDKNDDGQVVDVNGKKYKQMGINVREIHALIDVALQLRFLLIVLTPTPKKGSRGEKIMDDVYKIGPKIRDIAKRCGHKLDKYEQLLAGTKEEHEEYDKKLAKCKKCKKCNCDKSNKKGAKSK